MSPKDTPTKTDKDLESQLGTARTHQQEQEAIDDLAREILRLTSPFSEEPADEEDVGSSETEGIDQSKLVQSVIDRITAAALEQIATEQKAKDEDTACCTSMEKRLPSSKKEEHKKIRPTTHPGILQATTSSSGSNQIPVVPPTQLVRNTASNTPRAVGSPGAYAVAPSSELSGRDPDSSTTSSSRDLVESPSPAVMTAGAAVGGSDDGATTLEAVRVDDITVRAEPMQEGEGSKSHSQHKIFWGSAATILLLVLILATTLTRSKDDGSDDLPAETLSPTYDPDTRLSLLREFVFQEMKPLYERNYKNKRGVDGELINATMLLEDALYDPQAPQNQACLWLAHEDSEVAEIRQPWLDQGYISSSSNTSSSSITTTNVSSSLRNTAGRRLLRHQPAKRRTIIQRYVLAVLYYSTTEANVSDWTDSFEFLTDGPECDWSGSLLCDSNGSITHLELQKNNLQGTIPLELGALTALDFLQLGGNPLQGTLPEALSELTSMKKFDVASNDLTGTVPDSLYQSWKGIETWNLATNHFSGTVSSHLSELVNLKAMAWAGNDLEGTFPASVWTNLSKLEEIDFSRQTAMSFFIGTEIGKCSNLQSLAFNNMVHDGSIPTQLGLLTKMTHLGLAGNHITGTLPSEIGAFSQLDYLTMSMNAFTGTVPTEFAQLTSLTRLFLQNTLLTGDVSFLCEAIDSGRMNPLDHMRFDMQEVTGCSCCTCCHY
ncbi:STYKc [Seminavis robusta]|uniref:STYKc n=1 Tax=Seminavis robusta TaxID=568900 RepID=A0A9N8DRQ2_9STRA|nr:STYKc [Seminavis robusta]|eukprot:Sro322_g117110.1 STYKc (717) ;mRNA; f:60150-62300